MKPAIKLFCSLLTVVVLTVGCTGTRTFTTAARPGETVALAVGYRQHLQRLNMTVTITDSTGATVTYPVNDSRVRGVVNLYLDPVSKFRVGKDTGQALDVNALNLTNTIQGNTGGDSDWWLTTVLLDLPTSATIMSNGSPIATGPATVSIADAGGNTIRPASIEVLPGSSSSNNFNVWGADTGTSNINVLTTYPKMLKGMERADHFVVAFQATTIPHSVQAVFTHTPNVGVPAVINQRGEMKNVSWSDDGAGNLKVMITPPNGNTLVNVTDLKFYIAGGLTGLSQPTVTAYDINGNLIAGVTATATAQ